jgi:hypothetical protein
MTGKNVFFVILGVILFVSGLIAVLGLVADTSDHMVPREHICLKTQQHPENSEKVWDIIVRKTGIDEKTASLSRISFDIDPDNSVEKMELQFIAEEKGAEGFYSIWYRRDSPGCGWIDGFTYPGIISDMEPGNIRNPGSVLEVIEEIPLSAMNFSGKTVSIRGDCTRNQQVTAPHSLPGGTDYLWLNQTLVPRALTPSDPGIDPLFCLEYSQKNCTTRKEGITSCQNERSARVFSPTHTGSCRCISPRGR